MRRQLAEAVIEDLRHLGVEPTPAVRAQVHVIGREAHLDALSAFAASALARAGNEPSFTPVGALVGRSFSLVAFEHYGWECRLTPEEAGVLSRALKRGDLSTSELSESFRRRARPLGWRA